MNGKRPTVASVHGLVAAAHPLAAQAGARILGQGGNAFDAAVATAAAIGVVEPFMSGLAGNGMATVWSAAEQRVKSLQFRAGVPRSFPLGRFRQREELQRGAAATTGPGNFAGWCELLRSHGTMTLAQVLAPAIALARDGFPMIGFNITGASYFIREAGSTPFFADWAAVHATVPPAEGTILRQPDLARTFEALAADGPAHLYGGPLGKAIVAHVQGLGGFLTMADIEDASHTPWAAPVAAGYRGLMLHSAPPPSQAFQFLLGLRILEGFDLAAMDHNGVEHLNHAWRAVRLAAGARINAGNPSPEKLAALLSDESVARLRQRLADGTPISGPTEQWIAPPEGKVAGQHTTSLSVADRQGNMVCITQSLGGLYGCGVVVPGTGVCLNNALYWGELDQRGPNALIPGGALMTSVSPSIGIRDGAPVLAIGTPGSYGITQTQTQAMVHLIDFKLPLQEAIEAPRARLWDGTRVQAESRIDAAVLSELGKRGHSIDAAAPWTMAVGGMQALTRHPATGALTGAADPRREGYVAAA